MTTLLNGLLGGLLVGIAATLAVEMVGDGRSAVSAMLGVLFDEGVVFRLRFDRDVLVELLLFHVVYDSALASGFG